MVKNIRCRGVFFPTQCDLSLLFFAIPTVTLEWWLFLFRALWILRWWAFCLGFVYVRGLGSRFDSLTQRFVPVWKCLDGRFHRGGEKVAGECGGCNCSMMLICSKLFFYGCVDTGPQKQGLSGHGVGKAIGAPRRWNVESEWVRVGQLVDSYAWVGRTRDEAQRLGSEIGTRRNLRDCNRGQWAWCLSVAFGVRGGKVKHLLDLWTPRNNLLWEFIPTSSHGEFQGCVCDHGLRNVREVEQLPCAKHGEDNCVWTFCHLRVVCALFLGWDDSEWQNRQSWKVLTC